MSYAAVGNAVSSGCGRNTFKPFQKGNVSRGQKLVWYVLIVIWEQAENNSKEAKPLQLFTLENI